MAKKAILEAEVTHKIPFHDVDVMEVAWHGHYVKYFEMARCALLEKIDYDYPQMRDSGYAWPVIDCQLRYIKPAFYGTDIVIKASLVEYENRLKVDYLIRNAETGERLSKGSTIQVAVKIDGWEMQLASPQVLLDKLGGES